MNRLKWLSVMAITLLAGCSLNQDNNSNNDWSSAKMNIVYKPYVNGDPILSNVILFENVTPRNSSNWTSQNDMHIFEDKIVFLETGTAWNGTTQLGFLWGSTITIEEMVSNGINIKENINIEVHSSTANLGSVARGTVRVFNYTNDIITVYPYYISGTQANMVINPPPAPYVVNIAINESAQPSYTGSSTGSTNMGRFFTRSGVAYPNDTGNNQMSNYIIHFKATLGTQISHIPLGNIIFPVA